MRWRYRLQGVRRAARARTVGNYSAEQGTVVHLRPDRVCRWPLSIARTAAETRVPPEICSRTLARERSDRCRPARRGTFRRRTWRGRGALRPGAGLHSHPRRPFPGRPHPGTRAWCPEVTPGGARDTRKGVGLPENGARLHRLQMGSRRSRNDNCPPVVPPLEARRPTAPTDGGST